MSYINIADMNKCCRDAKSYLEETEVVNIADLQKFIDRFNIEIENYSVNGLSSYLLSCVELCLKLSGSIGYTKGHVVTKWLKGHALFLGGFYKLAHKSYLNALKLVNEDDLEYGAICSSYSLNLAYVGEFEQALSFVEKLINSNAKEWANYTISAILKYRNETKLSQSLIERHNEKNNNNLYYKINRLLDLNDLTEAKTLLECVNKSIIVDNDFFKAYNLTLKILIDLKEGSDTSIKDLDYVLNSLGSKKSFYHYIDGLLNIAEIYLINKDTENCNKLLLKIEIEKRELVILDCRLYKLLEKVSIAKDDFKKAHEYVTRLNEIYKRCTTFDIDKSLREISSFLYENSTSII